MRFPSSRFFALIAFASAFVAFTTWEYPDVAKLVFLLATLFYLATLAKEFSESEPPSRTHDAAMEGVPRGNPGTGQAS